MSQDQESELSPLNAIRTETVLSRFPIHNLSKKGLIDIHIKHQNEKGEVDLYWDVSYSDKHGQARQLAYKLDTLIVNRRIDEAGRPVPKIIRLGSLTEICRDLGLADSGKNRGLIRKALLQNAFAAVTAEFKYKGIDGRERDVEVADTRYGTIFTGEKLPDGNRADAVYASLHDFYREIINTAPFRPLDYHYLKSLSPAAQRCYEVVSYRIFAAVKHKNPTAKIPYSEYCMYSGQERYFEREKARKQMWKLHHPHLKSQYFTEARFENMPNHEGEPDWMLVYVPGKKALDEYKAFTRKQKGLIDVVVDARTIADKATEPKQQDPVHQPEEQALAFTDEEMYFIKELADRFNVHEDTAKELVTTKLPRVKYQLEVYSYRQEGRIKDSAAYIIRAIERNYTAPTNYLEAQAKKEKEDAVVRAKALEDTRKEHEEIFRTSYYEYLRLTEGALRTNAPEEYLAFEEHNAEAVMKAMRFVTNHTGVAGRAILSEETRLTRFRDFFLPRTLVLSFWKWDEAHNPHRFMTQ